MAGELVTTAGTIRVFGSTRAIATDGTEIKLPPKARNMLALLVAGGIDGLTTEQILDEVANGDRSASTQSKIRMDLSRLRQRIGEDVLPPGQGRWRVTLPQHAIDHHALLARPDVGALDESELLRLVTGAPFRESHHSPLVQLAIKRAVGARARLVEEVIDHRSDLLVPAVLDTLAELVVIDPFDDEFSSIVLRAHLAGGEGARARTLLAGIELAFREQLVGAVPSIDAGLRREILRTTGVASATRQTNAPTSETNDPFVGRADAVKSLVDWAERGAGTASLITGRAGIGKSRLVDEVTKALGRDIEVIRIAGRETARSALEPWREGLPALEPHLRAFLDEADTEETLIARARLWDAARSVIAERQKPLVVIDDAQWFDSLSLELAEFLIRTAGGDLQVLIAGRPPHATDWLALHDAAAGAAELTLELGGLDRADLEELVGQLRPTSRLAIRSQFTSELSELCGGLPAVARPLIEGAVGEGLHVPTTSGRSALAQLVEQLDPKTQRVALALAVLGLDARWVDLVRLAEATEREVLDGCSQLASAGLATFSTADEPKIRLGHVLIRDAILEVSTDADRWRLNRDAAELAESIHRRAEHQFLAYPLVDGSESGHSLLASAQEHVTSGALREAINAYQRAQLRFGETPLPIEALILWAGSLDRLGLQGHRVRVEAVHRALESSDTDLALDAALSGLPEAEVATGDVNRLDLLLDVPHEELSANRRFDHAHATGRQLAVLGRSDEAQRWLDRAAQAEPDPVREDTLRLARWLAEYPHRSHGDRLADESFYPSDDQGSVWITHLQSLDSLGAARLEASERLCAVVKSDLSKIPNPYLRWHNLLMESTAAFSAGRMHDGMTTSNLAFEHGVRYGLRESGSAWLAQVFMAVWMQRGAAELLEQMMLARGDIEGSFLAESAFTVALYDAGQFDAAASAAAEVAHKALEHRSFAGCAALLLVSRVLRDSHERSKEMYQQLLPLRSSLAVVGGGFACLGPVDMALGFLAGDAPSGPHFAAALELVDQHEVRGWQIAARLELARNFGDSGRRSEAVSLAAGLGWDVGD